MSFLSVVDAASLLGEAPLWDARDQVLYYLDYYGNRLHRYYPTTGRHLAADLPQMITALAATGRPDRFAAAFEDSVGFFGSVGGQIEIVHTPLDQSIQKFNDGKCDSRGRFWVGYMAKDWESARGGLLRFDPDGSLHVMDTDISLGNGLAWSPDDELLYFADSTRNVIYAYDYAAATGAIRDRRVLISMESGHTGKREDRAVFDGLCVDSEGNIWVAIWAAGAVRQYAPDGGMVQEIPVGTRWPSSCMFGGADLKTLFVTSAAQFASRNPADRDPFAGNLFARRMDVAGLACHAFGAPS